MAIDWKRHIGREGKVTSGAHTGRIAIVERDPSDSGWHVYLVAVAGVVDEDQHWDIWAEDDDQVTEWIAELGVVWEAGTDSSPTS